MHYLPQGKTGGYGTPPSSLSPDNLFFVTCNAEHDLTGNMQAIKQLPGAL